MYTIKEKAYAKINIFLEVQSRLENGYHNIDTVMQTVSLCDEITVDYLTEGEGINITCTDPSIPTDSSNIVYKCAKGYLDYCRLTGGVNVHIEKNIPVSAGLGGGSADGAAVLRALNKISQTPISIEELCRIGVNIGADIPFCVVGGAVRCMGVGEVFMPSCSLSPELYLVIAKGKQGSNTAEAYKAIDGVANRKQREMPKAFLNIGDNNSAIIASELYNAFEQVVLPKNKEASAIKRALTVLGATGSLMSGSGSAVFGIFESQSKAQSAVEYLKDKGHFACICRPVASI